MNVIISVKWKQYFSFLNFNKAKNKPILNRKTFKLKPKSLQKWISNNKNSDIVMMYIYILRHPNSVLIKIPDIIIFHNLFFGLLIKLMHKRITFWSKNNSTNNLYWNQFNDIAEFKLNIILINKVNWGDSNFLYNTWYFINMMSFSIPLY